MSSSFDGKFRFIRDRWLVVVPLLVVVVLSTIAIGTGSDPLVPAIAIGLDVVGLSLYIAQWWTGRRKSSSHETEPGTAVTSSPP